MPPTSRGHRNSVFFFHGLDEGFPPAEDPGHNNVLVWRYDKVTASFRSEVQRPNSGFVVSGVTRDMVRAQVRTDILLPQERGSKGLSVFIATTALLLESIVWVEGYRLAMGLGHIRPGRAGMSEWR